MNNYSVKEQELIKDLQDAQIVWIDPDFVSQNAELMGTEERHIWFSDRLNEMGAKGATFFVQKVDAVNNPKICLVGGWLINPKELSAMPSIPDFQMEKK